MRSDAHRRYALMLDAVDRAFGPLEALSAPGRLWPATAPAGAGHAEGEPFRSPSPPRTPGRPR